MVTDWGLVGALASGTGLATATEVLAEGNASWLPTSTTVVFVSDSGRRSADIGPTIFTLTRIKMPRLKP